MANIKNKNYRKIDCRLINDNYMDFMISKDDIMFNNISTDYIATELIFNNKNNKQVISNISWINSIPSNTILKNIGYTGVDNGFISYEKDRISNDEFLDIYTDSKFDLSTYDNKFFVTEVNSNSRKFSYLLEKKDDYTSFKGGFYQGFFKIEGDNYQTLPHLIQDEWNFYFILRKQDYEVYPNTLNKQHPNNEGIFFFIGSRAENKFAKLYNKTEDEKSSIKNVIECQYLENNIDICPNEQTANNDYFQEQIDLNQINLEISKLERKYEIETDNKFIIFNNTKDGFTSKTWNDNDKFILVAENKKNLNYFPYLNHSKNGFTIKNINTLNNINNNFSIYNVNKDLENNALALKINNDGSISYRYLTNNNELLEESSKPKIINNNEWHQIQLKIISKSSKENNNCYESSKMQLYIYVNGHLKLISKELPKLNLKPLNDNPEKQEGVPYSISIGGGSQGLSDTIDLNYYNISNEVLTIEKYFGGTFIGDIKKFVFIPYSLKYPILNI